MEPTVFKDHATFIHNTTAFVAFSLGPTACVGRNLAYLEMRMLTCAMMHKFDIRFEDGFLPREYEKGLGDFFVMMRATKLPVVFTARK